MESKDRSGPLITFPLTRPGTGATPVSMSATSTPLPVYPAAHDSRAWTIEVISSREPVSTPADVAAPVPPPSAADARAGAAGIRVRAARAATVADRRPWLPGTSPLRPRSLRLITSFNHAAWWKGYRSLIAVHPQRPCSRGKQPEHAIRTTPCYDRTKPLHAHPAEVPQTLLHAPRLHSARQLAAGLDPATVPCDIGSTWRMAVSRNDGAGCPWKS